MLQRCHGIMYIRTLPMVRSILSVQYMIIYLLLVKYLSAKRYKEQCHIEVWLYAVFTYEKIFLRNVLTGKKKDSCYRMSILLTYCIIAYTCINLFFTHLENMMCCSVDVLSLMPFQPLCITSVYWVLFSLLLSYVIYVCIRNRPIINILIQKHVYYEAIKHEQVNQCIFSYLNEIANCPSH